MVCGEVVEGDRVTYWKDGEIKADMPADSLVLGGGAPQYVREATKPEYLDTVQNFDTNTLQHSEDFETILLDLFNAPNIASKRWVHEQYDTTVRTNTVNAPGASDSGLIRIKGTKKGLAVKTDCNGRYVYLNPRKGGQIAVAESARNVVCSGGKPVAITNCLNFGNPYKPEVYWTFREALGGMGDACRRLNTPVTGGNVSFYNENPKGAIFPTPVIGMLGIVEDVEKHQMTPGFKNEGDAILYIGADRKGLGGSEYLNTIHHLTSGDTPDIDLDFEANLQEALLEAIKSGSLAAVHDISDGGLAVTLAEMSIFGNKGAGVSIESFTGSKHEVLFSEAQSGVVISCRPENIEKVLAHFEKAEVPAFEIGTVGGAELKINDILSVQISAMSSNYEGAIPEAMKG